MVGIDFRNIFQAEVPTIPDLKELSDELLQHVVYNGLPVLMKETDGTL